MHLYPFFQVVLVSTAQYSWSIIIMYFYFIVRSFIDALCLSFSSLLYINVTVQ